MSAVLLPTRRPLWVRWWRAARIAYLRACIAADERWVADCERTATLDEASLQACRRHIEAQTCALMVYEAQS